MTGLRKYACNSSVYNVCSGELQSGKQFVYQITLPSEENERNVVCNGRIFPFIILEEKTSETMQRSDLKKSFATRA